MASRRLTAISPHLDDAVFSCAGLLAAHPRARVITVFAGVPPADVPLPEWDAACGFAAAREAMLGRRDEDRQALGKLGARGCWLDFWDSQYGRHYRTEEVRDMLRNALAEEGADVIAAPLGLFHSDHRLASAAALQLLDRRTLWLAYEDALYRRIPALVQQRLSALRAGGLCLTPFEFEGDPGGKAAAVHCYASQLRGLATPGRPGLADLAAPERYWRIEA